MVVLVLSLLLPLSLPSLPAPSLLFPFPFFLLFPLSFFSFLFLLPASPTVLASLLPFFAACPVLFPSFPFLPPFPFFLLFLFFLPAGSFHLMKSLGHFLFSPKF